MSESHLVSVVLGAYNGEAYLEEQLRSVLAQTWTNLEIIAIGGPKPEEGDGVRATATWPGTD